MPCGPDRSSGIDVGLRGWWPCRSRRVRPPWACGRGRPGRNHQGSPWGDAAVELLSVIPDTTPREAAMNTTEDRTSGSSRMAEQQAAGLLGSEVREGYAEIGDQRLHYVEAGEGPLVVLLHGFPEFWYGWRLQIAPLAAAGFRVVAPDTRGYNLSSKPDGVKAYGADKLADDVRGLIQERGAESALVAGHDWGGTAAWTLAMNHPEVVDRLAILNA